MPVRHLNSVCVALAFLSLIILVPTVSAQVNVTVDASTTVRTVDDRMFGLNTAVWDSAFTDSQTLTALKAVDARFLRYPGGSSSDDFNWKTDMLVEENQSAGATSFDDFALYATQLNTHGAQVIITVNYGTGTPQLAADWVTYSNVTKGYGFKYWEVGNECYGTWEDDTQAVQHDGYTYATRAVQYIQAMKAVDPTIKIGVVSDASEDSYINGSTHSVTNPVTGLAHSGFTPVMLATMKSLGVLPDFLIYHFYAQNPGNENDATLLQAGPTWPIYAKTLRAMLTDYLGTAGNGIELLVTENNSVSYNPGKQSVSLVNGLYMADSVASLMQTEFNSLIWWDLHNGQGTGTTQNPINLSSTLYGWREYGDYGIESGGQYGVLSGNPYHDPYPMFYSMKLMSHFARGGDTVVSATSNNTLLSAYSVKRVDGSLSILLINKSPSTTYTVNLNIAGYTPLSSGTLYSYGMTQDNAAKAGTGSTDIATTAISNGSAAMSVSVPPYSLALYSLSSPTTPPVAKSQPVSQTVASGSTVVFSFGVSGSPSPTYQWYFDNVAIPSGTNATLVVGGATAANAGSYTCVATNSSGTVTSSAATLGVVTTSNPGRLSNLSCRAYVGTGQNIMTAGFVIGGSGTAGDQPVLIRASGPALAQFNLTGLLADPKLALNNTTSGTAVFVDSDTGWGGAAAIATEAATLGAFSWGAKATPDSALAETLAPGNYTAQVSGVSGDTGVALVEVYDATPAGTYTVSSSRLINLSTLVQVQAGSIPVYDGFVIAGTTAKTVLIRATGPTLKEFGLSGLLADPQLILTNITSGQNTVITTNTGWAGDPVIKEVAASVGAFSWGSAATADSAILITLPPGNYTAGAVGASQDMGLTLIELYEVP